MVRRIVFVVVVLAVLGFLTRSVLKSYSLELVHIVVVKAVAQKAPDNYPRVKVYQTFSRCLEAAQKKNPEPYLQKLYTLSHGLEKVQLLEEGEVDTILRDLECN